MSGLPKQILLAVLLCFLFVQCAQIGSLGGGKRDLDPPKLLEAVPANKTVDVNTGNIVLSFDEFVQFKNPDQLVITPAMKTAPEILAEGKKLKISFKREELMPSTTYRFFFGACIADMHEGNFIKDFEYVFSTGPSIDTLKLSGIVLDATNNLPVSAIMVGLYDSNFRSDSLPYKRTPEYICKTATDGKFEFTYLPAKHFEIYALADNNKNNLYDGDAEKAAFYGPTMNLTSDTSVRLRLFHEESPKTFIQKSGSPYYGYGQIILNKKSKVSLKTLDNSKSAQLLETNAGALKDTVIFYYKGITDTLNLNLTYNGNKDDTLKMTLPRNNTKRKTKNLAINTTMGYLPLGQKPQIIFPLWMDTSIKVLPKGLKLTSKDDSLISVQALKGHWLTVSAYEIQNKLKEGATYKLKIDTAVFRDVNGLTNDSTFLEFKCRSKTDFGKMTVKLKLNKKQSYVVQLINEQQKVSHEQNFSLSLSSSNAVNIDFTDVLPGNYTFKVIYDNNENKKWDGGNLLIKKLPEQVFISQKQLKVLADWEFEEEILVKE